MNHKELVKAIGFTPKDGTTGVFTKEYSKFDNYSLQVDFENEKFNYGELISSGRETTLNFSKPENWVVFECVNRLLEQGYQPKHIILEKSYPVGRGSNIYLDILVTRVDGTPFLMIECKTAGWEYDKELRKLNKEGGQIFSYFQQDRASDYLMVYASDFKGGTVSYNNEIIKIEDEYRQTNNVKDLYDIWNKLSKSNGILESGIAPYHFKSKALTPKHLKDITHEDSSKIFNRFLEILRHNVVSDKPNAFNKIFTLFLCKIYDEKSTMENDELKFQWLEGIDDNVKFQKRLTDLYAKGMEEFLEKEVTDFSDEDFDNTFGNDIDKELKDRLLKQFTRIRLEKNNEFAIKEVFDHASFEDNGKVVKEVVELLQNYKIRYTKKQHYLSDFFELLLTTGLKQESGQFFTPVPVAQFVIRSLPIDTIVKQKLEAGKKNDLLPTLIDYAAGSGHFLTESMHIIQEIINSVDSVNFIPDTKKKLKSWKEDHFEWANQYIYGIEKDYRLVKVGKVGCYLHGDGIANVVHSDGLGNFENTLEYTGALKKTDSANPQDNRQFDMVVSNPPYSVSAFRNNARKYYTEKDFELYNSLTDQSSEIECLFIERTKQLLKDGGVAGIILPSSVLSNGGIYMKAREIILKHFDIIGITELGSNTFMATNTTTTTLFLRRRNIRIAKDIENSVNNFASTLQDMTVNSVEKPVAKYVAQVWEELSFEDYCTLFQKKPNNAVKKHEIYQEYDQKIKKRDSALFDEIILREKEKLLYFILAYGQQTVLVKSGEKNEEKTFLGYEFSNRRGNEGIHPYGGKSIDERTKLYDSDCFNNPEKASTYIYDAFAGNYSRKIDISLKKNVRRVDLVDMFDLGRAEFDKSLSLAIKKKVKIPSRWELVKLSEVATINPPKNISNYVTDDTIVSFIEMASVSNQGFVEKKVDRKVKDLKNGSYKFFQENDIIIAKITPCMENGKCAIVRDLTNRFGFGSSEFHIIHLMDKVLPEFVFSILNNNEIREIAETHMTGASGHRRVPDTFYSNIRIPLPPKEIQEKIVAEVVSLEKKESNEKKAIVQYKANIEALFTSAYSGATNTLRLSNSNIFDVSIGRRVLASEVNEHKGVFPVYSANVFEPFGYINKTLFKDYSIPSVLWGIDGDWMVNFVPGNQPFYPTDHCGVLRIVDDSKMNYRYLAYALNIAGKDASLSRTHRASIDRVKGLSIKTPSIDVQNEVVKNVVKIETEITKLEANIANIPAQKVAILKKHLS